MNDLHDTIVALSTAPGPGARAIVRLSGPDAVRVAGQVVATTEPIRPRERRGYEGNAALPGVATPFPVELYIWPAPRSYTGQNMAELHTVSCPPLVELLVAELLQAGARAAQGGEFTLRAFLAGKLDLPRAEAVLGIIDAGNRDELRQALAQLAGNVSQPLGELRSDLLDLLADVEAGLDFTEEDIHFVGQADLLTRLAKGMALVTVIQKQLEQRAVGSRPFRAVLVGRPNAGKSSLFNTLTGGNALVSPQPGTTRDYLVQKVEWDGVALEIVDTAGLRLAEDAIESQAQTLGQAQGETADLLLLCIEAGQPATAEESRLLTRPRPPAFMVHTKCDRLEHAAQASEKLACAACSNTSARTGMGLDELRRQLIEHARARPTAPLAPSLSRCRHHVQVCLQYLRQAHGIVLYQEPPELLALELRGALDQLGEMVGAVYTDDLLDRIFSRFCIGK